MRWLRFAVLILITTMLQTGLVDITAVTTLNIKPDLLLILLVFFAIYCSRSEAIITSFAIGFAADIIGSVMGPKTISFGLFGTALACLSSVIAIKKMFYQSLVTFLTAILAGMLAQFLTFLKGQPTVAGTYTVIFGTAIYSAILGPFLFLPAAWWMRIKTQRFRRH
jgi:rod shape-determining protein MreD